MTTTNQVADTVHQIAREGFEHTFGTPGVAVEPDAAWAAVRATGTSLWLDTGDLDEASTLWNAEFEALTTNNTLLNKEVQKGLYDDIVAGAAARIRAADPSISTSDLALELAFALNARHGLRLVDRFDAYVSVELHTDLAHDVDRTVAYGLRYHAICPERFYVKVPLTPAGVIAARRLSDAGVAINLTLGFSARQNVLTALVARPAFVNVFMGRLNAFVADNQLGDGQNVGEKTTLATQRALSSLRAANRTNSRLIGASMRTGEQVGALAGLDVYTMPPKVAAAYHAAPLAEVTTRVADDPDVTTTAGVAPEDFAAGTLWDVPPAFEACACEIADGDPSALTPDGLIDRLTAAGFGDLFPRWSESDIGVASEDGKIPVYAHWKDRLRAGEIGLDALMNLSAFRSFATDQAALDGRVSSLIT